MPNPQLKYNFVIGERITRLFGKLLIIFRYPVCAPQNYKISDLVNYSCGSLLVIQ